MDEGFKYLLEKQGYCFSGEHACVKTCLWLKKMLRGEGSCYKNTFYNIQSHRCIQMTPIASSCTQNCIYCWRPAEYMSKEEISDSPQEIVEGSILAQRKLIAGFKGNPLVKKEIFEEAWNPKHFAISLAGEPCLYPKLGELLEEIHKRNMTSFLVTNGTLPHVLQGFSKQPTQLYISLSASNEEMYKRVCNPLLKDNWENLNKTLEILPQLETRKVIRMTLIKNMNDSDLEGYASLIKKANPHFLEIKSYMRLGCSKERIPYGGMLEHSEIMDTSRKMAELLGWRVIDNRQESRVALVAKEDYTWRKLTFD